MIGIDDFRRVKNPHWESSSVNVVRERVQGGQMFRQLSDGSVLVEKNECKTVRLPEGITVHETPDGLQVNHPSGVVVQIDQGELYVGDGLTSKHYGRLMDVSVCDDVYIYQGDLGAVTID